MLAVLRNDAYARLFSAQVVALLGTGLFTVALGLLAFDVAGGNAGVVLGVALTIKMIAYVAISPLMTTLVSVLPRKLVLVGADAVRAVAAVSLPLVTAPWQIYLLVFMLQSASATFTPTFQSVIPAVLPDEDEYTEALSLSRLAYDLESLVSPVLAAALLTVIGFDRLFIGTVIGFLVSAALVITTPFPRIEPPAPAPFLARLTSGIQTCWTTSELRGLLGLNLAVAAATAMVLVNTVVLVQGRLGRPEADVAILLGAYGAGSMIVALLLPRILRALPDRSVMRIGGGALPVLLLAVSGMIVGLRETDQWAGLLIVWVLLGAASSTILTPSARLLRRGSTEQNRTAVFTAQFSLSHACFLISYPIAGVLGAAIGLPAVAVLLAIIGGLGTVFAILVWRGSTVPMATVG